MRYYKESPLRKLFFITFKENNFLYSLKMKFSLIPDKFSLNFWRKKTEKKGKGAVEVVPPRATKTAWNFTQERKAKEILSRIV